MKKLFPLFVVLFVLLQVSNALALGGYDARSEACRTFHHFSAQKQIDKTQEIDGLFCDVYEGYEIKDIIHEGNVVEISVDIPTLTPEPPVVPTTVPTDDTPEPPEEDSDDHPHCNKGEGNGGEGCDPGNHPEHGNDDED